MLFNGFARPLRLKRKPSPLLGLYLVCLHGLALFALCQPLAIPLVAHVVLLIVWLASVVYHAFYYRRQHDDEPSAWVWQSGGSWLRGRAAQAYSLIIRRSLQTPWFVMLCLAAPGRKPVYLLILYDQIDADSFRRLRVRLKCYQDEATARRDDPV